MDKPIVVFRADGHAQMGLGHLIRSSALAEMLSEDFHCVLVYRDCPEGLLPTLREGFSDFKVANSVAGSNADAEELVEIAEKLAADKENSFYEVSKNQKPIIVLDGYQFKTSYHKILKDAGFQLVCIDDIYNCIFLADVVINHAPSSGLGSKYRHSDTTSLAIGLAYSLLRPDFLRAARLNKKQRPSIETNRFFICFGGSDFNNVGSWLLKELTELGYENSIDIVVGIANPHFEQVKQAGESYPGSVTIHRAISPEEITDLLVNTRLAFLPASTIMLEAIALRAPIVGGYYIDNQIDVYGGFIEKDLITGVGNWNRPTDLTGSIKQALSINKGDSISKKQIWLDGHSDANLQLIFQQLLAKEELLLPRAALPTDIEQYFSWVNEEGVRQNSISTNLIPWEGHQKWFMSRLHDPNCELYVFTQGHRPIGQIRFDIDDLNATIDYSVDIKYRGKGYGSRVVKLGESLLRSRRPEVTNIVARVKISNLPSKRVFERLGYIEVPDNDNQNSELISFNKLLV